MRLPTMPQCASLTPPLCAFVYYFWIKLHTHSQCKNNTHVACNIFFICLFYCKQFFFFRWILTAFRSLLFLVSCMPKPMQKLPPQLIIFFICLHTSAAKINNVREWSCCCISCTCNKLARIFVARVVVCLLQWCCSFAFAIATGTARCLIWSPRRWTCKLADCMSKRCVGFH